MSKTLDLVGQKFGRLLVVSRAGSDKRGEALWECECDCGAVTVVAGSNLRKGRTKSCGCYKEELLATGQLHTTHGMCGTPTYSSWQNILQRCLNKNSTFYYRYGGRGIKICEDWLTFENFYRDMGECPETGTIDRIDNNGDYEPGNCRWATQKTNSRNKNNNVNITYLGKTQCVAAWEEELGFNYGTLWNRLYTFKWSLEKAMTEPVINQQGKINFEGKYQTLTAHARDHGLKRTTVDARLLQGYTLEEALNTPARVYKSKKK
jgi:hypothetical protein